VIAEFVGFQIVWLVSAIGAAQASSKPGAVAAAIFVALQVLANGGRFMAASAVVAAVVGSILESLLAFTGLVTYAAPWPGPGVAPLWIMTLWLAYGTTIASMSRLLGAKPQWKAAALGALFGPLAYVGGAKLGALNLSEPLVWTWVALSLAWASALPLLVAVHSRMETGG
jgi:hypothetical protein